MAIGWLTAVEVRVSDLYWDDSEELPNDGDLESLLTSARVQCEEFAPALTDGQDVPENWRLAQGMQARALWRSTAVGSGDQMGMDGMSVTVFPMDWSVKALLRPAKGRFIVG